MDEKIKQDSFCFLYYDGEAARDKAQMDRLTRGAYDDIIATQRKHGHLTIEHIKGFLKNDFDHCWPMLVLELDQDETGKYFIAWVDRSVKRKKEKSATNKAKAVAYWEEQRRKKALENKQYRRLPEPEDFPNDEIIEPEETELTGSAGINYNGLMDVDLIKEKVFLDKENFVRIYMSAGFDMKESEVYDWLGAFNLYQRYTGDNQRTEKEYRKHFGNWLKFIDYKHTSAKLYKPVTNGKNNSGGIKGKGNNTGTIADGNFGDL